MKIFKKNKIYKNEGFISWKKQWQERLKLHNNSPEKFLKLMRLSESTGYCSKSQSGRGFKRSQ